MEGRLKSFEEASLPHLSAAYNLARWLTRNDTDAEDVVQEAYLRALKHFGGFHGTDGRPWLLAIVRNTCYTWMQENRAPELHTAFDEEVHTLREDHLNPEILLLKQADNELIRLAVEELSAEFREVIVLRELEGLSYREIADVAEIPVGTVMSRLARARKRLQASLSGKRSFSSTKTSTTNSPVCSEHVELPTRGPACHSVSLGNPIFTPGVSRAGLSKLPPSKRPDFTKNIFVTE